MAYLNDHTMGHDPQAQMFKTIYLFIKKDPNSAMTKY